MGRCSLGLGLGWGNPADPGPEPGLVICPVPIGWYRTVTFQLAHPAEKYAGSVIRSNRGPRDGLKVREGLPAPLKRARVSLIRAASPSERRRRFRGFDVLTLF
jgi:hypothetical protein